MQLCVCVAGILHLLPFKVCFEGEISKASVMQSLSRGKRASGDLIPWTVSQQVTSVGEVHGCSRDDGLTNSTGIGCGYIPCV